MIGKVNSAGSIKKLVSATASDSVPSTGRDTYVTLTCDFDPIVIYATGPDNTSSYGFNEVRYRNDKDSPWQNASQFSPMITVNGRTISCPFRTTEPAYAADAFLWAWGFPD